jgi:hypothetical protein
MSGKTRWSISIVTTEFFRLGARSLPGASSPILLEIRCGTPHLRLRLGERQPLALGRIVHDA